MHEYSIAYALVHRVEAQARAHGAVGVHGIRIRVGELSGVEPQLLASAYDTIREQTICAHAELRIETSAVCWACPQCGYRLALGAVLQCPDCRVAARLVAGSELVIEQIEMEVE